MVFRISSGGRRPRSGAFVDTDLLVRTALFLSNNVVKYREIEERSDASKAQAYENYLGGSRQEP
jgi:hypothetical protein